MSNAPPPPPPIPGLGHPETTHKYLLNTIVDWLFSLGDKLRDFSLKLKR